MDGTEDSSYLTLLNDGTHNYLLQTTQETLGVQDTSLNVEPMFTEIEDGSGAWSVGLPILMNGNLIPEADQELEDPVDMPTDNTVVTTMHLPGSLPELYEDSLENQEDVSTQEEATSEENPMSYPIEIPGKGFITADGLFIANDLLLQLKLEGANLELAQENTDSATKGIDEPLSHVVEEEEDILINPKTLIPLNGHSTEQAYVSEFAPLINKRQNLFNNKDSDIDEDNLSLGNGCLENEQVFSVENSSSSNDIIRLINIDGTVINISKEQLLSYSGPKHQTVPPECIAREEAVDDGDEAISKRFEVVTAHKCKQCSFLCEEQYDMMQHWRKDHLLTQPQLQNKPNQETVPSNTEINAKEEKSELKSNLNGEVKMKSILKNKGRQTVYICSECNLGYGSTAKLREHMMSVHNLVQQPDEKEEVVDDDSKKKKEKPKPKLTRALLQKQAKASKKLKCSVKGCDVRFALDDMRRRHEKCHVDGQKKQFKCLECDSKFSIWRVCSLHMWKCHKVDLGLFSCPMCSIFKSYTVVGLLTHMEIHEEEKPYLCNACGKSFRQFCQLRNHQVCLHTNMEIVPEWAHQQQCEICKKYFANSKSLKKHVQIIHDKFKPYICNICGHKTARKAMLELHMRQHTGEKPHKCPICEYKTGDHNSLRRHVMRHSGDTKYSCPHCKYSSIQSTSYKNHIANKHPGLGGSFFCTLCSYHTVNENAYTSHLADHKCGLIKDNDDKDNNAELCKTVNSLKNKINTNKEKVEKEIEDDETQSYLMSMDHSNDAVDTGGITIPAGFELPVPL